MTTENRTLLFTDLVGSTERHTSVAPDMADVLRRDHFTILRQSIAEAGGREVKNLGDGLMVVFPTASAAVACAVAMQQGVEFDGRGQPTPAELRIGLSGGEVTLEDDDYFGDAVIEASRLCAASTGGQILAAELVILMAGRRNPHPSRPTGAMTLKGIPEPVAVVEVLWEPVNPSTHPSAGLPGLLVEQGGFPFAGRERESQLLGQAFAAVRAGATRLVLVAGEPGIGKTRLTAELAQGVVDAGGLVLAGRSDELVGIPYQPFVEALRWRIAQPDGVDRLGSRAAELVRLVPELAQVLPDLAAPLVASPEAERLALFEAVRDWLATTTDTQPVLLVLDDLHWADMGSLLLLRHVMANDPVPGLLAVATYRDTDLDRTRPLSSVLAEFHRRADIERISLGGLAQSDVTDLLSLSAGHELDPAGINLASALTEDTGGNPFFVGEVLRHLVESGVITQQEGRWIASPTADDPYLPESIRQVVGRRVSALPDETQKLLSSASVIGARFGLDLLATVSGSSPDEALDVVEPALAAHLVLEIDVGRYQFAHALVRSTLHAELSTTRRARLHHAVAQALEAAHADDLDAVLGDLAYHWGEAGPVTGSDAACTYARRAAELASARLAPDDAVRWYRIARERLDGADPALDAELLLQLGLAESLAGEAGWNHTLLDAARAAEVLGDVSMMARALEVERRMALSVNANSADPEKLALLHRALALSTGDVAQKARLCLALAAETLFTGDLALRNSLYVEGMALADQITDPLEWFRTAAGLSGSIPWSMVDRAWSEQNAARGRAALPLARAGSDHEMERTALFTLWWNSLWLGLPDLEELLAQSEALFAEYPSPLLADDLLAARHHLALIRGELDLADEVFDQIIRHARIIGRDDMDNYEGVVAAQRLYETTGLGSIADVVAADPVIEVEGGRPGVVTGFLAHALAESGRLDEAGALVTRAARHAFTDLPDDGALPMARSSWTEAAVLVGDVGACGAMIERLLPYHDIHQVTGYSYFGSTARLLARLEATVGHEREADHWFARAVEDHLRIGSPSWLARTQLDWAEVRLRRGDAESARDLATAALVSIGELDLTVSRNRAETVLKATHASIPDR